MAKESKYHEVKRGQRVIGRIVSIRGHCNWGMEVGDEFELSAMSPGGLCPYLYYNIYPYVMTLQFGGEFPDEYPWAGDRLEFICPDVINAARIQLRREGVDPARHPNYLKDEEEEEERWRKKFAKD